jgi:thioredoxin 1
MKPMKLSPPIIAEQVHGLGKAVAISGHLAKADVKIFRYKSSTNKLEEIWDGPAPNVNIFNVVIPQLQTGDSLFAVQEIQIEGQLTKSADPPPKLLTAVFPQVPLITPYVNTPLYTCARMIGIGNIINGAMVQIYRKGNKIYESPIGYPNLRIHTDPLESGDDIYVVQSFPDIKPATSKTEYVVPYPERRLPKPTIRKPLMECAPSFEVEGLVPGASLFVREKQTDQKIAEQVVGTSVTSVDAEGGLRRGWTLVAAQQLCGENDRSQDSDEVEVEEIGCLGTYPPKFAIKPKPGDTYIVVKGLHESTIRILADGKDIGGGTCYGITTFSLDAPLPSAKMQLIQSLDCRGKVWEAPSQFVRSVPDDEVLELTESTFYATISTANLPLMVDFWAPWCSHCVDAIPYVEQIAKDYAGKAIIAKLDITKYNAYGDNSVPMFRFYENGQIVDKVLGFDETKIRSILDQLIAP